MNSERAEATIRVAQDVVEEAAATHQWVMAARFLAKYDALNQDRVCEVAGDDVENCGVSCTFQEEQWYMPAKFLPPMSIGDRYCFLDGEVWQISDVDIELLDRKGEHVKVAVWWCRPAEPDRNTKEGAQWFGEYKRGDSNWIGKAKAAEIWEKCGSRS